MSEINDELAKLAEGNEKYAEFNRKILNTGKTVLGVRTPDLRRLARKYARGLDVDEMNKLFRMLDFSVFEQNLFSGMIIIYSTLTEVKKIEQLREYLKRVDSWSEVDLCIVKITPWNSEIYYNFANELLGEKNPWAVRYGLGTLMENYLDDEHIETILKEVKKLKSDEYYVQMSIAWLLAMAAINYPKAVKEILSSCNFNNIVRGMAIRKILDSYRIPADYKNEMRELRAKFKDTNGKNEK